VAEVLERLPSKYDALIFDLTINNNSNNKMSTHMKMELLVNRKNTQ
jgi:hypothetical protein